MIPECLGQCALFWIFIQFDNIKTISSENAHIIMPAFQNMIFREIIALNNILFSIEKFLNFLGNNIVFGYFL